MKAMRAIQIWLAIFWLRYALRGLYGRHQALSNDATEIRRETEAIEADICAKMERLSVLEGTPAHACPDRAAVLQAERDRYQAALGLLIDAVKHERWGKAKTLVADWESTSQTVQEAA